MNLYLFIFNGVAKKFAISNVDWMIKINFMLKKLVAGLYVDRISFAPLNEY